MLNQTRLLKYIKTNIGFPWQFIEMNDEEILDYVQEFTLREFSYYFPDTLTIGLNVRSMVNLVPNKETEYYLTDPDGREILNVANIYFSGGNLYLFGHPPYGPMSLGEIPQWVLSVEIAGWVKQFSSWNYTYTFKSPNIIRILPAPTSEEWIAVEYEREHAEDFSTIPNGMQMYFCELALADVMIMIGRLRKRFGGEIATPFGNIPLASDIYDEGKEKKQTIIDKLTQGSLTNVVVSFG